MKTPKYFDAIKTPKYVDYEDDGANGVMHIDSEVPSQISLPTATT